MIPKENGMITMLRRNTCAGVAVLKKSPERGVDWQSFERTKPPSVLSGEFNLTGLVLTGRIAVSRGETWCWIQAKVRLIKKPGDRNSRLNKTDPASNICFTCDIKE